MYSVTREGHNWLLVGTEQMGCFMVKWSGVRTHDPYTGITYDYPLATLKGNALEMSYIHELIYMQASVRLYQAFTPL